MKTIIFLLLVALSASKFLSNDAHNYWYTALRKTAAADIPYADIGWNYCDLKCLYLEILYPGNDFVVVNFVESAIKPNFAACYVKQATGGLEPWNKVATNAFFEKNCGGDTEDYLKNTKYSVAKKEGEGLGT
jgi:hypothetical protein